MHRGFGRIAIPDARDTLFKLKRTKSTRKTKFWADRTYWGDQGNLPHCVGYAWAHWLNAAPITNWINPDGLYRLAQYVDDWPGENYDGTSVRAGAKILHTLGMIERYEWCWDVETLIETVLSKGPVVVGTNWSESMMVPNAKGVIKLGGRDLGGHAYLISGCSRTHQRLRIKNSWGQDWGDHGRAWISFNDMSKLIQAGGEVCLAVERLAKPPKPSRSTTQKKMMIHGELGND